MLDKASLVRSVVPTLVTHVMTHTVTHYNYHGDIPLTQSAQREMLVIVEETQR